MVGVLSAFAATHPAGIGASPQHRADGLLVGAGTPCCDRASGSAYVGAVEVEADALGKLLNRLLTKAGVGAGDAAAGTPEALLDAADQRVVRISLRADGYG